MYDCIVKYYIFQDSSSVKKSLAEVVKKFEDGLEGKKAHHFEDRNGHVGMGMRKGICYQSHRHY